MPRRNGNRMKDEDEKKKERESMKVETNKQTRKRRRRRNERERKERGRVSAVNVMNRAAIGGEHKRERPPLFGGKAKTFAFDLFDGAPVLRWELGWVMEA